MEENKTIPSNYQRKMGTHLISGSSGVKPDLKDKYAVLSFNDGKTIALFIDDYETPVAYYEKKDDKIYHAFIDKKQYLESSPHTMILNKWIIQLSKSVNLSNAKGIESIKEVAKKKEIDLEYS